MTLQDRKPAAVFAAGILVVALLSAAAPQEDEYAAILGVWEAQTEDGIYTFEFEFSILNGELVGKYHGFSGTRDMQWLTYDGGLVKFQVDVNGMILNFMATVAKGRLSGVLSLQHGDANIIGTKRDTDFSSAT